MTTQEAMQIVLQLAIEGALEPRHCDDDEMLEAAHEQSEAIETVQDLMDNWPWK